MDKVKPPMGKKAKSMKEGKKGKKKEDATMKEVAEISAGKKK